MSPFPKLPMFHSADIGTTDRRGRADPAKLLDLIDRMKSASATVPAPQPQPKAQTRTGS